MDGGVNSVALNVWMNYDLDFIRSKHIWDIRVIFGCGIRAENKKRAKKIEDIIDVNPVYEYRFKENWYYPSRLDFRNQFWKGYDYTKNAAVEDLQFYVSGLFLIIFEVNY
ncbi:MAG: DUF3078 domain-containing protein [Flavobacteriales bacterium AspAUS03]